MRLPVPPLLLVTDRRQARSSIADVVEQALAAGGRWVSVRERDLPDAEQLALALALRPLARRYNARLTLHGSPALARTADIDGVHLSAGGDPAAARALLGDAALIGISVHTVAEAEKLDPAVVDYAIAGPAYETASKPGYGPALGPAGLGAMAKAVSVPIIAIGGIEAANVADIVRAGAAGAAVMGGVMRAAEPGRQMHLLLEALKVSCGQPRPR